MNKLSNTLKLVISALENDSVKYDWNEQGSCNCGLVAQAILNIGPDELHEKFHDEWDRHVVQGEETIPSWRNLVHATCNVTGLSQSDIINSLRAGGLRPEDIVHLEYMENAAILKEAGMKRGFFNRIPKKYHEEQSYLVRYLKAWVRILDAGDEKEVKLSKDFVERALLRAVSKEDYEEAARLRDSLVPL